MNRLALFAGIFLSLTLPGILYSQTVHISHCIQGCPTGTANSNEIIVRHLFAVSINQQTRLADWLTYRIIPGSLGIASLLPREWQDDELMHGGFRASELRPDAVATRPGASNRQDSVYSIGDVNITTSDRGRLVPMTSFAGSSYWPELNLLSVLALMKFDMRVGPWARLDQEINELMRQSDEIFVVVGPIYPVPDQVSRDEAADTNIPSAYFKVVASAKGEVTAFVLDQNLTQHANYCNQIADLDTVQSRTGLDLFPRADGWPTGSLDRQLGC